MRESVIIGKFNQLDAAINQLMHYMQLGFSGNALHEETLKSLLMEKGIFTETEYKDALSAKIQEINNTQKEEVEKAKETSKTELIKPSADDTKTIEDSKK